MGVAVGVAGWTRGSGNRWAAVLRLTRRKGEGSVSREVGERDCQIASSLLWIRLSLLPAGAPFLSFWNKLESIHSHTKSVRLTGSTVSVHLWGWGADCQRFSSGSPAPSLQSAKPLALQAESPDTPAFFDYPDSDQTRLLAVARFIGEKPVPFVSSGMS